jgi:hypothetical protein
VRGAAAPSPPQIIFSIEPMGRHSTGALEVKEVERIELSYLLKKGYICKGKRMVGGVLTWEVRGKSTGSIRINSCYKGEEVWVQLIYQVTDNRTGKQTDFDYKIELEALPSNLGRGEVLYFVCSESGKRCRVLYRAYDSLTWKSREAYDNRLY